MTLHNPTSATVFVECASPFDPCSYCIRCKALFKSGDEIFILRTPLEVRYGKQLKKLKAETHRAHKQHLKCVE
jgi:hypothetical protein